MQPKPFSPLGQAIIIALSIGVFTVLWPIGTTCLLLAMPGQNFGMQDGGAIGYVMAIAGFPIGVHVGMLIVRRTLWLSKPGSRFPFVFISALFAVFITLIDWLCWVASQEHIYQERDSISFAYTYTAAVQGIPILWFVYNLHGGTWLQMLAARRLKQQSKSENTTSNTVGISRNSG